MRNAIGSAASERRGTLSAAAALALAGAGRSFLRYKRGQDADGAAL